MGLPVQIALQGGGAKICALIAAMEAVEARHQGKTIKVTRIAGTSAGAIVGALFAAGYTVAEIKAHLLGGFGEELVKTFTYRHRLLGNFVLGRPLWSPTGLERKLTHLFQEKRVQRLGDTVGSSGIKLIILAADLGEGEKVSYHENDSLVTAVMDSFAIPFCFRVWNKGGGSVRVDGGLCENLPSDELLKDEAEYGQALAFTFTKTRPGHPASLMEFTRALVDTALSNSVARARSALPQARVHEIETDIGTFEFDRALKEGLRGAAYNLVKTRTEDFLKDHLYRASKPDGVVPGDVDPWREANPTAIEVMTNIGRVYQLQHAQQAFQYRECSFEIVANCLQPRGEGVIPHLDKIRYWLKFEPVDQPIYCLSAALSVPPAQAYLGRTLWEVRKNGDLVKSVPVPSINPEFPEDRELIHFFDPVIQPGTGPYTLLFRDEAASMMEPLLRTGRDEMVFTPRRAAGTVDRINLVLHLPKNWHVTMQNKPGNKDNGRALNDGELSNLQNAGLRSDTPHGFQTIGWVGENVPAGLDYGIDLKSS